MDPKVYRQSISLMMRTTYLYYEKGYSQSKISKILGISVSTVSRLLNNAKKAGMVSFVVDERVMEVNDLEMTLRDKYALKDVIVARSMETRFEPRPDEIKQLVAFEAAQYLQRIIGDTDILGITMGRTIYHMINSFNPCKKSDTQFVTLHGSIDKIDRDFNVDTLAERMAMSFGGQNYCLNAPGLGKSGYEARMLMSRTDNQQIIDKYRDVNISVSGIGAFYPEKVSYLNDEKYFSEEEIHEIEKNEVYADIGLRLIDRNGEECNTSMKNRTIGISYDDYRRIPTKVLMASGVIKKEAIKAAIRGKAVDVLIIDYDLAKAIR